MIKDEEMYIDAIVPPPKADKSTFWDNGSAWLPLMKNGFPGTVRGSFNHEQWIILIPLPCLHFRVL